ncbi:hypothetical protein KPATCC21470_0408 [Kitasatospora purpeofusca]
MLGVDGFGMPREAVDPEAADRSDPHGAPRPPGTGAPTTAPSRRPSSERSGPGGALGRGAAGWGSAAAPRHPPPGTTVRGGE